MSRTAPLTKTHPQVIEPLCSELRIIAARNYAGSYCNRCSAMVAERRFSRQLFTAGSAEHGFADYLSAKERKFPDGLKQQRLLNLLRKAGTPLRSIDDLARFIYDSLRCSTVV